jgi:hypothetical protein
MSCNFKKRGLQICHSAVMYLLQLLHMKDSTEAAAAVVTALLLGSTLKEPQETDSQAPNVPSSGG